MASSSTRRALRARPKTKSTRCASHQAISASRAKPLSARSNPNPGPAGADLPDNARDLLKGAGRGVDVGAAQPGRQQVPAAEDVERQVAVGVVVAVEEAALLMPVQGNVGRVEVEDDLPGWPLAVRLEEEIDEQRLDRRRIMADAVIATSLFEERCSSWVWRHWTAEAGSDWPGGGLEGGYWGATRTVGLLTDGRAGWQRYAAAARPSSQTNRSRL